MVSVVFNILYILYNVISADCYVFFRWFHFISVLLSNSTSGCKNVYQILVLSKYNMKPTNLLTYATDMSAICHNTSCSWCGWN